MELSDEGRQEIPSKIRLFFLRMCRTTYGCDVGIQVALLTWLWRNEVQRK